MIDIRKIIIVFIIAVLFSVLVFSTIEAVYPGPEWTDYCNESSIQKESMLINAESCNAIEVNATDQANCNEQKGFIEFSYNSKGCATEYTCNTCERDFRAVNDEHSLYVFYISAAFALLAIFIGLYLPAENNPLNEWIGTGFMLGGTFTLIFGTATCFIALQRFIRPIVILLELALVIFITYKKLKNLKH